MDRIHSKSIQFAPIRFSCQFADIANLRICWLLFVLLLFNSTCAQGQQKSGVTDEQLYESLRYAGRLGKIDTVVQEMKEHGEQSNDSTQIARAECWKHYRDGALKRIAPEKIDFTEFESKFESEQSRPSIECKMFQGFLQGVRQGDWDGGAKRIELAVLLAEQAEDDQLHTIALSFLAELHLLKRNKNRAITLGMRGLTIAEDINFDSGIYLNSLAIHKSLRLARLFEAATPYAIRITEMGPRSQVTDNHLLYTGHTPTIDYYEDRLERMLRTPEEFSARTRAATFQLMGDYRTANNQYDMAIELYDKAIEALGDSANAVEKAMVEYSKAAAMGQREALENGSANDLAKFLEKQNFMYDEIHIASGLDLAKTFEQAGNWKEAFIWTQKSLDAARLDRNLILDEVRFTAKDYWNSKKEAREKQRSLVVQQNQSWRNFMITCFVITFGVILLAFGTERMRALLRNRDLLETKVIARTKSLRKAQVLAERAAREKSEFLARVNHEIRNPLTAILGYCELLELESAKNAGIGAYIDGLRTSSQHLMELVGEVLDITRIENGSLQLSQRNFDLQQTCQDVANILGEQTRTKELEFTCRPEPECVSSLFGDETLIKQLLINLLGNAIKFTSTGSVSARFETEQETGTDLILVLRVEDTGIGIQKQDIEKVFAPFVQSEQAEFAKDGKGLGLYICKCIVAHLEGTIHLKSELGKGTQVTVRLPMLKAAISSDIKSDLKNQQEQSNRVLIVDDQPLVSDVIRGQLVALGHQAEIANEIDETIRLIETWAPNIVLMDLRMPDNDGFAQFERIKKRFGSRRPTVIAITGDATSEVLSRTKQFGFDGFISKPFRMSKLLDQLAQIKQVDPRPVIQDIKS